MLKLPVSKLQLITFVLCAAAAAAEVIDLSPFEVTGSRISEAAVLEDGISISADDLNTANPASVWDVFESISGIQVEQPAGLGGNASIYVRGGEPNSAKVLIDGMDVGNIMDIRGGSYNFSGIGLSAIERINFLAGSRSAIHGSDALSGVISISTFPAGWENRSSAGEVVLQGGQGGLFDAGIYQGIRLDNAYLQMGTSYTREDSWIEGSDFEATRLNFGVGSTIGDTTKVKFTSFGAWLDRSHYPDDSGGPLYAVWNGFDQRETEQFGVSLQSATVLHPDLILQTHVYSYRFDESIDSPGVAPGDRDPFGVPPNSVNNLLKRYQLSSHLLHNPIQQVSLVYGFSYLQEEGDSDSTVVYPFATIDGEYSQSVSTASAFMETEWQVSEAVRLNGAVRYDDIEDLDDVWTGRLESVIQIPGTNSEWAISWGSGFKKPTFFALGNPVIGNPDLLPEESDLYEVSIRTRLPNQKIDLTSTLFRQEYDNLIDFSESPPPRMVNLNEVISEGFSSRAQFYVSDDTRIAAELTYVDMEVVDSEELLRNRPKWKATVSIRHRLSESVDFMLQGSYVSTRLDSSIPTGTRELDAYFRLDSCINWKISNNARISLLLDNLLDEDYEELIGLLSPGLRIRSKLNLQW